MGTMLGRSPRTAAASANFSTDSAEFELTRSGAADCASLHVLAVDEDRPAVEHQLYSGFQYVLAAAREPRVSCRKLVPGSLSFPFGHVQTSVQAQTVSEHTLPDDRSCS